jgi:hypothetical protein
MYTRANLKDAGKAYQDAVKEHEIDIFVKYVGQGILAQAKKGVDTIKFPILDIFYGVEHGSDGLLNKYDPGPIPALYVDEVVEKLRTFFPDTDFTIGKNFLIISWA